MSTNLLSIVVVVLFIWIAAWNVRFLRTRQMLLLLASYLFYSSWGIDFLLVLVASSLLNFVCGILLRRRPTIAYLWLGVALNVLLLGAFKYLPPLIATGSTALWGQAEYLRHIAMPVGISFWTFQGLSYLFDLYREEEVDPSLLEFCLFMAFWPTVLAGPVCRLPDMLPQFRAEPKFFRDNISAGSLRIIQGVVMKLVFAQILGSGLTPGAGVIAGFDQTTGALGAIDVWLLAIGFGFQLFFDFAGYSHIVIGTALLFGIQLPENFARPFLSPTPSVFWTRWHMSLSFWIRDYIFVPLAALRRERWWPYVVFVISMTLFGLWHAAKWTFILWGIYHGVLLIMHRLGQQLKRRFSIATPAHWGILLSSTATFALVSLGWIFFRANNLSQGLSMFRSVFLPSAYLHLTMPRSFYVLIPFVVIAYFIHEGLGMLLGQWRAHYKLSGVTNVISRTRSGEVSAGALAWELFEFCAVRMWWWLTPTIFVLTFFIGLAILNRSSVVKVTPFMYTVF